LLDISAAAGTGFWVIVRGISGNFRLFHHSRHLDYPGLFFLEQLAVAVVSVVAFIVACVTREIA